MVQNRPSAKSQPLRISAANILETGKHRRGDGSILSVSSSPRGVPEPDLFPAYLRIRSIDGSETKQSLPGPRASTWGLPTELGAGETIARFQLCYGDIQESRNLESRGVSIPHRIAPAKNRERKLAVLRGEWSLSNQPPAASGFVPPVRCKLRLHVGIKLLGRLHRTHQSRTVAQFQPQVKLRPYQASSFAFHECGHGPTAAREKAG
jgi:hypothetical protein